MYVIIRNRDSLSHELREVRAIPRVGDNNLLLNLYKNIVKNRRIGNRTN